MVWNINTEKTQKVLNDLFGTDRAKLIELSTKGFYKSTNLIPDNEHFGIHLESANGDSTVKINFGFSHFPLIRFYISVYPSCCGIRMFHSFYVKEASITQEQLNEILHTFFRENDPDESYSSGRIMGTSKRFEVIMVEHRLLNDPSADMEVEEVENPNIAYKPLWNFFHTCAQKVRTRLQYNANSGNILHNMEVLF